ncbi:MAG TPA: PLP-dependent aminotransferase family protein [Kofleriaceae bacterium]|nr:PLP-dependent aminotransferase family protein [Kofleriaceae bacterium]
MTAWTLQLSLRPEEKTPAFLQIVRAVSAAVRAGRLRPGQRLPGSRALAASLGVHRNTVIAALAELEAEGWIEAQQGRGTFVSRAIAEERAARPRTGAGLATRPSYDVPPAVGAAAPARAPRPAGVLDLSGGVPDLRLVPAAPLWRAYRRVLGRGARELLDYGDPRGLPRLRAALAEMLAATRGLAVGHDDLLITRGSQMGLSLVARALVRPGDAVAVEALGYRPAWDALRAAGARLVPVPVDRHGLDVEQLARASARRRLRAIYVTPHHQYPTTAVMAAARRIHLLDLARTRGFAVIEDDYDNEFHYDGRPVLPLASADPAGSVVYVGTLSKVLAPALRVGYVVAPAPVLDALAALRATTDGQGDSVTEAAVAELLEDGEVARHVRRVRRVYQARRDAMAAALRRRLAGALDFDVPAGGLALWARAARGLDVDAWAARAAAAGVLVTPGRHYDFEGRSRPFLRIGYARLVERELDEAVRRLAVTR